MNRKPKAMTPATTKQVRDHYKARGFEVRITKRDGHVSWRCPLAEASWKEGRYVSEYLVDETGELCLL